MATFKTPIKYTNRDFDSIKTDLVQYAKRYYPDTYRDFNEASFGSLMLDTVAYVGDILSFYLDYQVNESFLDSAAEFSNVVRLSKQLGYKYQGIPAATGLAAFFAIVPANEVGLGVNDHYLPVLKRGTMVSSKGGNKYMLDEDIRFDDPKNDAVVARVNDATGFPTSYAIKAYGKISAGEFSRERIVVGNFSKFKRVPLSSRNISEIISVIDEEGHEYHEVDYLSQDVVYRAVTNMGDNKDTVSHIMKPMAVPRRFVLDRSNGRYALQFGYGSDSELNTSSVAEPSNMTLKMHARDFISDTSFDPSKILQTDKFGVGPSNTALTVVYKINSTSNTNANIGGVNKVNSVIMDFARPELVPQDVRDSVLRSFEVYNEENIVGGVSIPSTKELKTRAFDFFATQNRAVTLQDFEAISYAMPPKFGSIKRVKVVQDPDSFKRNLNMYILAESRNGYLTEANSTLKENLKTFLNESRLISDASDIVDAAIVNIGITYGVTVSGNANPESVIQKINDNLRNYFKIENFQIGQPIVTTDVVNIIINTQDVISLVDLRFLNKTGEIDGNIYSGVSMSISSNTSKGIIKCPPGSIFEVKFPGDDIIGTQR